MATKATRTKATTKAKELPFGKLVEKDPTPLHELFGEWIEENTGYTPDLKTLQIVTVLRGDFQRSETNQARIAESKKAKVADAEARAEAREAREQAKAEKAQAAKERKEAKAAAAKEKSTAAKKAPAKKTAASTKATATKKTEPVKKAAPRRRAAAKKA